MFHDIIGYQPSPRSTNPDDAPEDVDGDNKHAVQRWQRAVAKLNTRDAAARTEHPDGKLLYVQSKLVPARRRASIQFSNKGRLEVKVLDATDEDVAKAVAGGANVVTPLGAKALAADDGLLVYEAAPVNGAELEAKLADANAALAAKDAELAETKAQLAGLRKARKDQDPDAVKPDRLKPAAEDPTKK